MEKFEVVDSKVEAEIQLVDENKVDWKGRTALKFKYGGMKASLLILAFLGLENMGTFSLAVNSVPYFNGVMHYDLADAANMLTNYMGTSYILSIFVAILADTWIGRYKSVIYSGFIEFVGLALLTVQARYSSLKPAICNINDPTDHCETLSGSHEAFLFIGLYLVALGSAGTKAALPSHGADQFDENDPKEAMQMSTFFNTLLLAICLGGSVSLTFIVWIQINKGWDWGFGIGTIAILLGIIIFAAGLPLYRIRLPQGSNAFTEIIQVFVAALRNRSLTLPEDPTELYEIGQDKEADVEIEFLPHRDIFRFLDRAAIQENFDEQSNSNSEAPNPWKLCRVTQVENAKIILGMVPIFCCTIIMTLCLAQLQTFSIIQGYTMDTSFTKHFHIPPASLPIIPVMFLVIIVPIYDRIFVPLLRKFTGIPTGISHLQRIGVGLILSSISMAVAAIIEVKRKRVAIENNMLDAFPVIQPLPISTFWLSFQYFIFGIADMFTYVGLLQFFYSESPKGLKSTSTCFLWTSMALGYFLSTIIVKCVNGATKHTKSGGWLAGNNINRNHVNLFYFFLSIVSLINFCIYLILSKRYKYRPQALTVPNDKSTKE